MIRGIERMAKDMTVRMLRQEAVAGNLANATTSGYKTQRTFVSVLKDAVGQRRRRSATRSRVSIPTSARGRSIAPNAAWTWPWRVTASSLSRRRRDCATRGAATSP